MALEHIAHHNAIPTALATPTPPSHFGSASANMMGAPNAPPGHKDQLYLNVRCCSASRQAETLQPGGTASGMGRVNALLSPP